MYKYFEYWKHNRGMKRVYECAFTSKTDFDMWNEATKESGFKVYVTGLKSYGVVETIARK